MLERFLIQPSLESAAPEDRPAVISDDLVRNPKEPELVLRRRWHMVEASPCNQIHLGHYVFDVGEVRGQGPPDEGGGPRQSCVIE